jgi:hypothetical protein
MYWYKDKDLHPLIVLVMSAAAAPLALGRTLTSLRDLAKARPSGYAITSCVTLADESESTSLEANPGRLSTGAADRGGPHQRSSSPGTTSST